VNQLDNIWFYCKPDWFVFNQFRRLSNRDTNSHGTQILHSTHQPHHHLICHLIFLRCIYTHSHKHPCTQQREMGSVRGVRKEGVGKRVRVYFKGCPLSDQRFPTLVRSYNPTNRSVGSGPWHLLYCVVSAALFSFLMLCIARTMTLVSRSTLVRRYMRTRRTRWNMRLDCPWLDVSARFLDLFLFPFFFSFFFPFPQQREIKRDNEENEMKHEASLPLARYFSEVFLFLFLFLSPPASKDQTWG